MARLLLHSDGSSQAWRRAGVALAALLVLLLLLGVPRLSPLPGGGSGHGAFASGVCSWTPFSLPMEDLEFARETSKLPVRRSHSLCVHTSSHTVVCTQAHRRPLLRRLPAPSHRLLRSH